MKNGDHFVDRVKPSRAGPRPTTGRKIVVNIQNVTSLPSVYTISPEKYAAAVADHRDLADFIEVRFGTDYNDLEAALQDAEVFVGPLMSGTLPREIVGRAPRLRWLHHIGAGVDQLVPLDWLPPGAVLTKSMGAHLPNAAEYGITAILMLNTRIPYFTCNQRHRRWERLFPTSIKGKTLLIVGVGCIGGAVAKEAKKLGLNILGVRRSGEGHEFVDEMFSPDLIHAVLPRADFVFLSAVMTPATRRLIGDRELGLMKPGAGLSAISRIVDLAALSKKLHEGHLSGAVINAFDPEPLPATSPLWDTPNLIITPHVGTQDGDQYVSRVLEIFLSNMTRFISGEPLRFQVSGSSGY